MEIMDKDLNQVAGGKNSNHFYVIQEGDTIGSIAAKLGISANVLYVLNTDFIDQNPNILPVGKKLYIPKDVK